MAWQQFYNGVASVSVFRKIVTEESVFSSKLGESLFAKTSHHFPANNDCGSHYFLANNDWGVIILGESLFDTTPGLAETPVSAISWVKFCF